MEFERLAFWVLKLDADWDDVQWRGEAGGEKGKDLMATRRESKKMDISM
ncbi:hypothetical protein [Candidatus Lokiarchaeum ossiferum]